MALIINTDTKTDGSEPSVVGYAFQEGKPETRKVVYRINKSERIIEFFLYATRYLFFEKITLEGFSDLPELFNPRGYIRNKLQYALNSLLKGKRVKELIVTKADNSSVVNRGRNRYVRISYRALKSLSDQIGSFKYMSNAQKRLIMNRNLSRELPKLIKTGRYIAKERLKNAITELSTQSPEAFESTDIDRITDLLSDLIRSGHRTQIAKSKLFKNTKLKVDTVTLDEVISKFEENLAGGLSEAEWGKFFLDNLFLIDSKYVYAIPQLNVVLAGARNVDFGLVDSEGYLDIFEIKKPDTKLLASKKDRGNYVWDTQTVRAIVQAEKYRFNADSKRAVLKEDIKRERHIELDVRRPRAFLIIGNTSQFISQEQRDDFRVLKNQFKDLEIITYDQLLERIKNQRKKFG